jgi:hypothetical protein
MLQTRRRDEQTRLCLGNHFRFCLLLLVLLQLLLLVLLLRLLLFTLCLLLILQPCSTPLPLFLPAFLLPFVRKMTECAIFAISASTSSEKIASTALA